MTPLGDLLLGRIRAGQPLSIADYMAECLGNPQWGYYIRKDPLGEAGDFITAPEISQMFGELLGIWASAVWQSMGEPSELVLAELGPGRGTLMCDFLRAAELVPAFRRALRIHLVETSPVLRQKQQHNLKDVGAVWHDEIRDLPAGPLLVVANEFFDALPIRQYVRRGLAWHERLVGCDGQTLVFTEGPGVVIEAPAASEGDIFEINQPAREICRWLGERLARDNGAALVIDYGHPQSAVGDTLQAVSRHRSVPVLDAPGEADLTAHVDFQALAEAARPAAATSTLTQGAFLRALGIELRADRLIDADHAKADNIASACRRLIQPSGMGTLCKVRALTHPGLPTPPGFIR